MKRSFSFADIATVALWILAGSMVCPVRLNGAATTNAWSLNGNVAVREMYDGNVYLQSRGPMRNRETFITSLLPQAGVSWRPSANFDATLGYNAGLHFFHQEPEEDHTVHRGVANVNARFGNTAIESVNSIVGIDGADEGPTWAAPGAVPAAGGPAVRDRHDAIVYRNNLRVVQTFNEWFVRGAASWYEHDWRTRERNAAGYQNYADRTEWTAGADAGRKFRSLLAGFVAYRYGRQAQEQLLAFPERYDSDFHRILAGFERKPARWLSGNVTLGPELRRYAETVHSGFDRSRVNLFVDATLTLSPTTCDNITLGAKQFQQPGFSGRSAYTDLTYDCEWRHKFGEQVTVLVGTRAYNTYFLRPIKRNDWVVTPSIAVNYAASEHWNLEVSGGQEIGFTGNEGFDGRDYERTFVNVGARYTWK